MFLLFSFVFFSNYILANDGEAFYLQLINNFNDDQNQFSQQEQNQCQLDTGFDVMNNSNDALAQRCAVDICGAPSKMNSPILSDANFDQYVQEGAMSRFVEVEPMLKEIIKTQFDKNDLFISAIKERLKGGKFDLDFTKWDKWNYEEYLWRFFDPYIEFESDKTKPIDERISFKIDLPSDASEIFKKGIENYANRKKYLIKNSFSAGVYGNLYTLDEAIKILNEKWQVFLNEYEKKIREKPDFMKDSVVKINELKFKIEKNDFKDLYKVGHFEGTLQSLQSQLTYEVTGVWPSSEDSSKCSEEICQKAIQQEIEKLDFNSWVKELELKNKKRDQLTLENLSYCKSEFAMQALRDYDRSEFIKIFPLVKNLFLNNVFKKFSSHSKKAFKDYLDKSLNLSTKIKKGDVEKFIDKVKEDYKSSRDNTDQEDYSAYKDKKYVRKLFDYYDDFKNDIDPLKSVRSCSDSLSNIVWDGFISKEDTTSSGLEGEGSDIDIEKDNILVSMFSAINFNKGKGVLAHEMGHALSVVFLKNKLSNESYEEYMKIRECANSLYKIGRVEKKPIAHEHKGDVYRTEEDTADLISYRAISGKDTFFECFILEPSSDGLSYVDAQLYNVDKNDPHSAPLLRVLQEAIHKKMNIPSTCQELIKQNNDKYRFTPCF